MELKDLSSKFRELKNLVYDYRDKKEDEIRELNERHVSLKSEIDNNQKNYEKSARGTITKTVHTNMMEFSHNEFTADVDENFTSILFDIPPC